MRVALFTHNFLEPTHHAIAVVLANLSDHHYTVFAKRFLEAGENVPNVAARITYTKGEVPGLDRESFDLVHAIFDGKMALRAAENAHLAKLPFVLSFHGGFDTNAKVFDPRYTRATVAAAESATVVTVVSETDAARLRRLGLKRLIEVLPVPVDPALLPVPRDRDPSQLVSVARLVPKKGVDVALRALARLPRHALQIVGDGPLRAELEALTTQLGLGERTRFVGQLPFRATLEVMADASALLHPARLAADGNAEGTPQTILWAQAMGLPVVTTPTGSIPDIVRDGENGLLVPPDDADALACAVRRLETVPGLRESIACTASRSLAAHRLEVVVERLRGIYRRAGAAARDH